MGFKTEIVVVVVSAAERAGAAVEAAAVRCGREAGGVAGGEGAGRGGEATEAGRG
jgi:hypothetical protein